MVQVLRNTFSRIERTTHWCALLLFERDVFLYQRVDVPQNVVDVHADFIGLLFGNVVLIGVVLGLHLLDLRFEFLVCFLLFSEAEHELLEPHF